MPALTPGRVALLSYAPSAGGITGTLAVTEAADTLSAAGSYTAPSYTGTLAVTEAADTLTASGTVSVPSYTGTLAVTEANDTLSASGAVAAPGTITGTLAVTEVDDTLSASGSRTIPDITGTVNVVEAADVLAASGLVSGTSVDSHTNKLTIHHNRIVTLGRRNRMHRTEQNQGEYAHTWKLKVYVDGTACDGTAYTSPQITVTDFFTGATVSQWSSAKTTGITAGDGTTYSWQITPESDDFGALPAGAFRCKLTASPGLVEVWRHDVIATVAS